MYLPQIYENKDLTAIEQFIKSHPFGILITQDDNHITATHIPLELEKDENGNLMVVGHISKANQQWKSFEENKNVLVVFTGPHAYISSSWYNHINVPTWNYISIHLYGRIHIQNAEEVYESIKKMMNRYEPSEKSNVSMDKLPPDYVSKEIRGVVGFQICITKIQGAYKLSQNRNDEDYENIITALENLNQFNELVIADEMRKIRL
jgi:transcriptional regulator